MLRMISFISRFCQKCSTISLRFPNNYSIVSPISAHNHPKRYQSSSNRDLSKLVDANVTEDFDYETESPYSNIDFEAICQGDAKKVNVLKVIQLEIELKRQQGEEVPTRITAERWKDLLSFNSSSSRDKYLRHLWIVEMKRKNRQEKSQIKAQSYEQFKSMLAEAVPQIKTTSSPLNYHLNETTLFHRIRNCTMNRFYNYKLLQAEWFGPKILVDCSYEPFMDVKNIQSCIKQMLLMWSENRDNISPYDIIFCNVEEKSSLWQKFTLRIPTITEADSPVHFTHQNYLDMYPKEKLVYLTPHCHEVLEHYSHDDIYIIGAFVDANRNKPLSMAKAKKEKLRMAKLPLDKYLQWTVGHKSLPLNHVLAILNDLKDGLPWPVALKHVPSRKIAHNTFHSRDEDEKVNPRTAKGILENYRKNLVYDLLLKERPDKGSKKK